MRESIAAGRMMGRRTGRRNNTVLLSLVASPLAMAAFSPFLI